MTRKNTLTRHFLNLLLLCVLTTGISYAQKVNSPPVVLKGNDGKLTYVSDEKGNRVPDYSYSGYRLSETEIPWVANKAFVPAGNGDATATIQAAIDYVATLPLDANGFRGAVLLDKGTFSVSGSLKVTASGIILRGSGSGENGTVLRGAGVTRETLVFFDGLNDRKNGKTLPIQDSYLPVNASSITVGDASTLKTGDRILVHRFSTKEWIDTIGCGEFGGGLYTMTWKPGDKDLWFDRTITAVNGNKITLDAPLTNAIEEEFGGGEVVPYTWNGRISNVGIECIALVSDYDKSNAKDENHRWNALGFYNTENGWVRQVTFKHFANSAVYIEDGSSKITVEDCISTEPISEIGGFRRYTYYSRGQQVLFQRCYAENGYHDFAVGQCSTGPTVFVQCESVDPYSFSGGVESWSTAILFDVVSVQGGLLTFMNRGQDGNGAGWNAANSTLWNTTASKIECYRPVTAQNWSMGCWAKYKGDGYWFDIDTHIQPLSLFYTQLSDRLGRDVSTQARMEPRDTRNSTSPTEEWAAQLIEQAKQPATRMDSWARKAVMPESALNHTDSKTIAWVTTVQPEPKIVNPLMVQNGKLVRGGKYLSGKTQEGRIWNGNLNPSYVNTAGAHLTRYVPGRRGEGLTDDLDSMTNKMVRTNRIAVFQQPSLWYERRRDDHERIRREDGDVWAPLYEQPYSRSGQGLAWDGLSKYDLTKPNPWYFGRLKEYVAFADQKNLVLLDQHLLQHNIIEAGAHWADYPWRTANNINEVGFPEPVVYAGHKRVFMAEQFYDVTNKHRMDIFRNYVRHHLDNFPDQAGVVHSLSDEYTGPLSYMQNWVDIIKEWQQEKGKDVMVMLGSTKDVQDAILEDPERSPLIDVIDIRYWYYRADGSLYAPKGGVNLSPRQHARQVAPGEASDEQVYRTIKEYRDKYPDKAVIYSFPSENHFPWVELMAGASLPAIPRVADAGFAAAVAQMSPVASGNDNCWAIGNDKAGYMFYELTDSPATVSIKNGKYDLVVIDRKTGTVAPSKRITVTKETAELPAAPNGIVWLKKK